MIYVESTRNAVRNQRHYRELIYELSWLTGSFEETTIPIYLFMIKHDALHVLRMVSLQYNVKNEALSAAAWQDVMSSSELAGTRCLSLGQRALLQVPDFVFNDKPRPLLSARSHNRHNTGCDSDWRSFRHQDWSGLMPSDAGGSTDEDGFYYYLHRLKNWIKTKDTYKKQIIF